MERWEAETRFRELFARHHRALVAYFMRRIPNETDALDATEDVFVVAWRRLADIPDGDAARLWLYGVARNVLANHRRSHVRRSRLRARIAAEPEHRPQDPASDEAVLSIEEQRLLAALGALRPKDREVLLLTYWEHLSHEEIGRILGCSKEAVHVRRHRAVQRLGNAYRQTGQVPDEGSAAIRHERADRAE